MLLKTCYKNHTYKLIWSVLTDPCIKLKILENLLSHFFNFKGIPQYCIFINRITNYVAFLYFILFLHFCLRIIYIMYEIIYILRYLKILIIPHFIFYFIHFLLYNWKLLHNAYSCALLSLRFSVVWWESGKIEKWNRKEMK